MAALAKVLAAVLALACAAAAAAAATESAASPRAAGGAPAGIAWAVQVSDLHISWHAHPDIVPDLEAFAASVLAGVRPSLVLLTGDLVDAKTRNMEGSQQYPQEWEAYQRAWQRVASASGLDAARVLDLRGNHDVFSALRAGPKDAFDTVSATAAALGAEGTRARLRVTQLPPRLLVGAAGGGGDGADAARACPAAVLVGVDATPDVNMRAFTNFFGSLNATSLDAVAAALDAAPSREGDPRCAPGASAAAPVRLSYSHYPLGTIAGDPRPLAPDGGGRRLTRLLAERGVAAHVSGHLHSLAGPFMFKRHAAGGSGINGGGLPEFEVGDWKGARRWRLLAFDGPAVTVADYGFVGRTVASMEPTAEVRSYAVVVTRATSPGSAGHAAALAAAAGDAGDRPNVHALALPLSAGAPAVASAELSWACGEDPLASGSVAGTVPLARGTDHPAVSKVQGSQPRGVTAGEDAGRLYLARLGGHVAVGCGSRLWVQARVTDAEGAVSASPWRQVAQDAAGAVGAFAAGDAGEAALAHPNLKSRFVLGVLQPARVRGMQLMGWAFHLIALLLIPRLFTGAILSAHARLAYPLLGRSPSLLRVAGSFSAASAGRRNGGPSPTGPPPSAARRLAGAAFVCGRTFAGRAGRMLLLTAIWPLRVLAECWARCGMSGPCFPLLLAYNLLLLTGPWLFARMGSDDVATGLMLPWGVVLRPPAGGWVLHRCVDPCLGGTAVAWALIAPLTVWLALVSNTYAHSDLKPPGALTRVVLTFLLAPLAAVWLRVMVRVWSTYGPVALTASPLYGWLPLLAAGWLHLSWKPPPGAANAGGARTPRA